MTQAPLDTIYNADEAADRLRLTNRALIKIARKYGYCSRSGRDYLFSEADLLTIWQALREPAKSPKPPAQKAFPFETKIYERLVRLTAKNLRRAKT